MQFKQIGIGVLGLLLVAVAILFFLRPTQAPITDDVLETKEKNTSAYLEFIADNLASGGVRKDGIPAIDDGTYIAAAEAMVNEHLGEEELVFGVTYGDTTIAIPQKILYWHEIVNEETSEGKISVTYCPLTGTVIGYKDKNLGVSGKLYNSNLVMYDRATESYYPQMLGTAVTGSEKGQSLDTFPVAVTTWGKWSTQYPNTHVLSLQTGHRRDYNNPPYQGYENALRLYFPVAAADDRYHTKKMIHGIFYNNNTYVVVKEHVAEPLTYDTGNGVLTISKDPALDTITVTDDTGQRITHYDAYWFAWYAYHPDTIVINP